MSPNEWVALIVGLLAIASGLVAGFSWVTRAIVRDELTKATQPIQPGYRNGGESLADVAHTVKRIAEKIGLDDD